MAIEVGGVSFLLGVNRKQFNKDLKQVKKDADRVGIDIAKDFDKSFKKVSFGGIMDDLKLMKEGWKASNDQLKKAADAVTVTKAKYDALVKSAEAFKATMGKKKVDPAELVDWQNKADALRKQLSSLSQQAIGNYGSTSGIRYSDEIAKTSALLDEANSKIKELTSTAPSPAELAKWAAYKERIKEAATAMMTAEKLAVGLKRGAGLKSIFSRVATFGKSVGSGLGLLAKNGAKKLFGGLADHTQKATAGLGGLFRKLLAIVGIGALVKKAFDLGAEGMGNLYKADAKTKSSIASLNNALTGLKNALASAFAPILNVVAPILTKFIGYLTNAANAVAHFFAALTGQKQVVVSTGAVADGMDGIGDSAAGANEKADELKRTLMGFDKINKLDGEDDTDSGSPSGGNGGQGFTTVPVSGLAQNWADKLRESWEKADFYWLGELLANKMNDALANIPWGKIQNNARKLASSLATFLNGFIENANWKLVGETIAQGLNTAVYFAQTFVHKFNWKALGKSVGDTINGFFRKTDWKAIGDTIGAAIKGALDAVIKFLDTVNWKKIGKSIVEMLTSIDWLGIFTRAVELIGKLAAAIFEVLIGAIKEARKKLKSWLDKHNPWDEITKLKDRSFKITAKIFTDWGVPAWVQKFLKFLVDSSVFMLNIKVMTWLDEAFKTVKGWLEKHFGESDKKDVTLTVSAEDQFTPVWNVIKPAWERLKTSTVVKTIKGMFGALWESVVYAWDALHDESITKTIRGAFGTLWETVKYAWNSLKSMHITKTIRGAFGNLWSSVKKAWDSLRTVSITKTIRGAYGSLWHSIVSAYNNLQDKWVTVTIEVQRIGDAIGDWWDGLDFSFGDFDWFASGGMPQQGQLFYAREQGPELVGTLKGHTAVMNNGQIVSSVSSGVAKAISGLQFKMNATPMLASGGSVSATAAAQPDGSNNEVADLLKQLLTAVNSLDLDVILDGESIKNNTVKRINNHTRATGQLELVV